ncbi:hypothetical protein, partial [Rurimicrobium arvi]
QVVQNSIDSLPNASSFYGSLVAEPMLWNSSSLRDNNGPWTVSLRELVNNYADETALASFFDGWSGGSAALAGATMPDYKLTTVYNASPARAITDMVLEAGAADVEDVITDEEDVTAFELGKLAVTGGMLSVDEMTSAIVYGTAGDTISLGEHHIYGSSRVGVQRYDSLQLANLLNLSDAGAVRSTLMSRVPWYSYAYADVISSSKKQEYDGTINTYSGVLNNTRNLGRRYYELTDHLGNVLATVLDRKTGYKTSPGATLYDHWSADLAQVSDYYPGGMMMPGRNVEYSWSRMGAQGSPKDDEVYGKGNFIDMGDRHLMTQILRTPKTDNKSEKYPSISPYAYVMGNYPNAIDPNGKDVFLITYLTKKDVAGHTALAVENYKQVTTMVKENGKEVMKTEFVKDGTVTIYELGPGGMLKEGKKAATTRVSAKYVEKTVPLGVIDKVGGSEWEQSPPDGIIRFKTDPGTDQYIQYKMSDYQNQNSEYCGTSNNCTDYAGYGAELATGKEINARESNGFIGATTPGKMFTEAKKAPNAEVIKDPGKAAEKPFDKAYKGED